MHHIMIICQEQSSLNDAERWLSRYGFQVNRSESLEQADKYYALEDFHLLLIDFSLASEIDNKPINLARLPPRIILDDKPSLTKGINAMAAGALYYLPLPTDSETLLKHIVDALEKADTIQEEAPSSPTPSPLQLGESNSGIIGRSPPMQRLFDDLQKVAGTNVTVLIRGESGTGKELVAKALHSLSHRHSHPIISVNCAAIPENLIESELFGHEKGAFTGAVSARDGLIFAAHKGTLFLDEIGELPLEAQARLLRVLQEGEIRRVGAVHSTKVDIRLVTATHRNLRDMVSQGKFREDLYYRLYVMELLLPPLRDRGEDISMIAKTLLEKACKKHNRPQYSYHKEFNKAIREHNWPGNVRELENAIERAVILSNGTLAVSDLKLDTLPPEEKTPPSKSGSMDTVTQNMQGTTLDDYFKHFVLTHQHKLTETQLAHSLGISRKSLWERRQKLSIPKKVTEY